MQGIDKIIETILHEAEVDAQGTKEQSDRHIAGLKQKAEAEVAAYRKAHMQEAMEKSFESGRRIMTMLDVKKRRDDLSVKRGLIDEVFAKAVDRINQLDISSYRNFIVSMLVEASETG
jgi:V/A-type H+-transporting ATPase subunit E